MSQRIVIVGAGLAGAKAAETLRQEGFDGQVVLLGAEDERPYQRPPLSKGLLTGLAERDSVYLHDAGWYDDHGVDLRTATRVAAIDLAAHEVRLPDDGRLRYDRLLLATGSSPRRLTVPGHDLAGVCYLRTIRDSDRIAASLVDGANVVIIGAGWIGLEIAAAARQRGARVDVVEPNRLPLRRVLGNEVARTFAYLHASHGVTFHFGTTVASLHGQDRVCSVRLSDGRELSADAVIVGIGATPNVELAVAAGLEVDDGIVTDAGLRTSHPDVFACGDVASSHNPLLGHRVRVEHWANALNAGMAAALALLDWEVSYDRVPYFYTDQYDLGMEYSGYVEPDGYDQVVFRGDPSMTDGRAPEFIAFWLKDGRVLAGMNVNVWDVTAAIQDLVRLGYAGRAVDQAKLSDPEVGLAELSG
ncbi:MAG TPA: FAD-dependent oxidoreductase [Micromonosporaceae bacterium]